MYVVEGAITVQKDPVNLIGKYGVYWGADKRDGTHKRYVIRKGIGVLFVARGLQESESVPVRPTLERITSPEQAARYRQTPTTSTESIGWSSQRRPEDLIGELNLQIADDAELLEGQARLWEQSYFPGRHLHLSTVSKLLEHIGFSPEDGWQHLPVDSNSTIRTYGLGVSGGHIDGTFTQE